ncbi:MAG: hypothetical protein JOZ19_01395 [Rubrobacter sp.]|nr:hypothetical protein [Rubrobacter sp.]
MSENQGFALQGTLPASPAEGPYRPFSPSSKSSSASSAFEEDSVQVLGLGGLKVGELGERSIRSFLEHRMMTYAAALAYQVLFALFPFIIFLGVLLVMFRVNGLFEGLRKAGRLAAYPTGPRAAGTGARAGMVLATRGAGATGSGRPGRSGQAGSRE